ncbi:DUF4440 domain-containing protein [Microbacteriaceae bacterium VKM Ac-2854]|nr:DUF4440 domain-containing protein [Microbacteriaceae bacterium VKM Ac-2854]
MTTPITELAEIHTAFAERFNARDLAGLLALNTSDALFVPAPGHAVSGDGIRAALEQFLALGLPITMRPKHAFVSGDTGLAIAEWSITGTGPDGSPVALEGTTSDVARRDGDAGWRFVIDNPFGTV